MLTFANKRFYLDGEEFPIYSGSLHYFRALPEYWESLLKKFRAAGLNTVETYVAWNLHEPKRENSALREEPISVGLSKRQSVRD